MLITKMVEIKIAPKHLKYWLNKGYDAKVNDVLKVSVDEISLNSNVMIVAICDDCGKERELTYQKYNMSKSKYQSYTCKDCGYNKSRKTLKKNYGVEYTFNSIEIKDKIKETLLLNYGVDNCAKSKIVYDKIKETNYKNGLWLEKDENEYNIYCKNVRNITNKQKQILIEHWDGKDYYDGESIKDYLLLNSNDRLYPTIDHKISVKYGYENNINENIIGDFSNLCFTKRWINSSKNSKNQYKNQEQ